MEFLSQYDGRIVYIKSEENCVADTLSRILLETTHISHSSINAENLALPIFHDAGGNSKIASIFSTKKSTLLFDICPSLIAAIPEPAIITPTVLSISADAKLLAEIKEGYSGSKNCPNVCMFFKDVYSMDD